MVDNMMFTLKCLIDRGGVINAGRVDAIPKQRVGIALKTLNRQNQRQLKSRQLVYYTT